MSILSFIVIFLIFLLGCGIVYFAIKSLRFRPGIRTYEGLRAFKVMVEKGGPVVETDVKYQELIKEKWGKILEKIKSGDEGNFRLAIIEADSLIDEILIKLGYQGKDMGERLKSIPPGQLESLGPLWEAHKLRNRIAHEGEFHLPPDEAKEALNGYYAVLKELELIQNA